MKAIWNDEVIAESNETVVVEGNHYVPAGSVTEEYLQPSNTTYECSLKGTANYYALSVAGAENPDAAWYSAKPTDAPQEIAGHIAFGNRIQIVE